MKRFCACFLLFALLCTAFTGCGGENRPKEKTVFSYFDTFTTVYSFANDSDEDFAENCEAALSLLSKYHRLFDIYHAYEDTLNLYTVNQMAGVAPVTVDPLLIDFLLYAKDVYTLTKGKTNIALGAVLSLWHNHRTEAENDPTTARIPDEEALQEAALHTDIEKIIIDKEANTVFLADEKMSLDVGSIGKGYAVEKAAALLEKRGVQGYALDVGGNLRVIGTKPDGEGWVTGIQNPDPLAEAYLARLTLINGALVTSGNYERYYTVAEKRYHHIIDPVTMFPAAYFASVTVYSHDSGLADALSTALFCMSYEEGLSLLSSLSDTEALWVTATGEIKMTEGMKEKLL